MGYLSFIEKKKQEKVTQAFVSCFFVFKKEET